LEKYYDNATSFTLVDAVKRELIDLQKDAQIHQPTLDQIINYFNPLEGMNPKDIAYQTG